MASDGADHAEAEPRADGDATDLLADEDDQESVIFSESNDGACSEKSTQEQPPAPAPAEAGGGSGKGRDKGRGRGRGKGRAGAPSAAPAAAPSAASPPKSKKSSSGQTAQAAQRDQSPAGSEDSTSSNRGGCCKLYCESCFDPTNTRCMNFHPICYNKWHGLCAC